MPTQKTSTVIAFADCCNQTYFDNSQNFTSNIDIKFCESFKDLSACLVTDPVLILVSGKLINNHGSINEFMLMLDTLIKFSDSDTKPSIGVIFDSNTSTEEIKNIQKVAAAGVFPDIVEYGFEEMKKSIEQFLASGKSNPKHLIDKLSGYKEKPKFKDIHLTNRQQQVYDLIAKRGLTNKQIAQVLKISESTVKIHVSAILKILCVRNRTQLALLTSSK